MPPIDTEGPLGIPADTVKPVTGLDDDDDGTGVLVLLAGAEASPPPLVAVEGPPLPLFLMFCSMDFMKGVGRCLMEFHTGKETL